MSAIVSPVVLLDQEQCKKANQKSFENLNIVIRDSRRELNMPWLIQMDAADRSSVGQTAKAIAAITPVTVKLIQDYFESSPSA